MLPEDFREFIELMISNHVRFVMIGGYAYNLYRNPRATGDIDFIVDLDAEIYETRLSVELAGLTIPVISPRTLLKNKQAAGRPKDLPDVIELQAWLRTQT